MKRQPWPNQHLALFQPKRKTNFTEGRADTGMGDHLQTTKVRHLTSLAGAGEISSQTLPCGKHLPPYETPPPVKTQHAYHLPSVGSVALGTHYTLKMLPKVSR